MKRSPLLPAIPTVDESACRVTRTSLQRADGAGGNPREILVRVQSEVAKIVRTPELHKRFLDRGVELTASASPEEFTAYVKAEFEKKARLARESGIRME